MLQTSLTFHKIWMVVQHVARGLVMMRPDRIKISMCKGDILTSSLTRCLAASTAISFFFCLSSSSAFCLLCSTIQIVGKM